jgi:hypothetical protein
MHQKRNDMRERIIRKFKNLNTGNRSLSRKRVAITQQIKSHPQGVPTIKTFIGKGTACPSKTASALPGSLARKTPSPTMAAE